MGATTVSDPTIHFINVEYFFRLLYDLIFGLHVGSANIGNPSSLITLAGQIWIFISVIAWIVAFIACWMLIYYTMRYWQITEEDAERYKTIPEAEAHVSVEHSRWAYIKQLIESPQETDWRQAIIEADIMLDETLTRNGYLGGTVGDKLKTANPARFTTLRNAWDAHTVRNDIAHQGSTFKLDNHLAFRTIQNYEAVFREFNEI